MTPCCLLLWTTSSWFAVSWRQMPLSGKPWSYPHHGRTNWDTSPCEIPPDIDLVSICSWDHGIQKNVSITDTFFDHNQQRSTGAFQAFGGPRQKKKEWTSQSLHPYNISWNFKGFSKMIFKKLSIVTWEGTSWTLIGIIKGQSSPEKCPQSAKMNRTGPSDK